MSRGSSREVPLPEPYGRRGAELFVDGVRLADLAERYGTPLYVTSEARLRANARRFLAAFRPRWPDYRLLYALKANPNPAIVRILASEGLGADCSSPAEIRIAREAGIPAERMLYTAAYPSDAELEFALRSGVPINLDDPALLPRLLALGTPSCLSFRINPGPAESGPEGLVFAGRGAKFGVSLRQAIAGYRVARAAGLTRFGLHTMPGSNVLGAEHFARVGRFLGHAARRVAREASVEIEFLDAGGGFGVPYRPGERALDLTAVAERLTAALAQSLGGGPEARPALCHEPGRYLLADTTVLLTRVTHVKLATPRLVGVDAGMHTLLRPALYGAYHPVHAVGSRPGTRRTVNLVGPVCENTDVLAARRRLVEPVVGDLYALGNAGAYGFSMSSQYNTRPRPAEVLVDHGRAQAIRLAEEFEDLVARVRPPQPWNRVKGILP